MTIGSKVGWSKNYELIEGKIIFTEDNLLSMRKQPTHDFLIHLRVFIITLSLIVIFL